ncbi:MAG: AAA family ATPase [Myxococcales bacterium]|nr:AAA family ATPase [Myxococcales bacterium]
MVDRALPGWAKEIRSTYLRGEASVFLLHGNVFDLIPHSGDLLRMVEFLSNVLLRRKVIICHVNASSRVKTLRREPGAPHVDALDSATDMLSALSSLQRTLRVADGVGLIIDYAEMLMPAGDLSLLSEGDRRAIVTVHQWSLDRRLENSDNVVLLISQNPSSMSHHILSNPRVQLVEVPLPDKDERSLLIQQLEPDASAREVERLAHHSAGLKNIQIRGILTPGEDSEGDFASRYELIREVLGAPTEMTKRASKLARMTSGMSRHQVLNYLNAEGNNTTRQEQETDRYDEVLSLLVQRKKEILQKETFGLVEFVSPAHDFSAVGGMDAIKRELMEIAHNIREGQHHRVPMGLLFTGPMGTGKTFVAEAFAKSSGLTAIKLKNFRSKWVGSTEANLDKILSVVKAIGNVLIIIDEGDRVFGSASTDHDGGASSRVIARMKEFMSDTNNRGRVLFILMTNRSDKLDADIKRAGRLDRKLPFFYAAIPEEVEPILLAQLRRHQVQHQIHFPADRERISQRLVGYSNAEVEAVVLEAGRLADKDQVSTKHMEEALDDYLPSREGALMEYMELLAVAESTSRRLLPKRFQELTVTALQSRLRELRQQIA